MLVVADTTPINYLVLIGEIEILPSLYPQVWIPSEVHAELLRPGAPERVRLWAAGLPEWCTVMSPNFEPDPALSSLDPGERDAILLAMESGADLLLIDERKGREEAQRRNLRITGTVGVLEFASQRGLVDFRWALERLDQTSFRLAPALKIALLARNP